MGFQSADTFSRRTDLNLPHLQGQKAIVYTSRTNDLLAKMFPAVPGQHRKRQVYMGFPERLQSDTLLR